MARKLFIGGIPYRTTNEELRDAFAQAGEVVSASIVMEKENPSRSRGFGFVEMATDEDAQKAIAMWHEKEFGGRRLTVLEARPKDDNRRE